MEFGDNQEEPYRFQVARWVRGKGYEVLHYTGCQREALESPVLAELPAGQGVFHHPLTLHGSGENRSEKPRRAIVINMALDGVRSNAAALEGKDTHNFPILPQGRALSGPYHPLLFSPERELGSKKNSLPLVDDPMEPSPEDE